MLRFYYNTNYKYTNRTIIDLTGDTVFADKDYENVDSPDTINGHIIYELSLAEKLPTYVVETLDENTERRWFVSGITQLRTGKYQISMLRDVASENPELWKGEQAFITNGYTTNFDKYKRWDLPFTNTKVSQTRLPIGIDGSKSSFFVFYNNTQDVSETGLITEKDLKISSLSMDEITGYDMIIDSTSELPNFDLVDGNMRNLWINQGGELRFRTWTGGGIFDKKYDYTCWYDQSLSTADKLSFNKSSSAPNRRINQVSSSIFGNIGPIYPVITSGQNGIRANWANSLKNFTTQTENSYGNKITQAQLNNISGYLGKVIFDTSTSEIFRVDIESADETFVRNMTTSETNTLFQQLNTFQSSGTGGFNNEGNFFTFRSTRKKITLKKIVLGTATGFNFNLRADTRKLPKSAVRCVNIVESNGITNDDIKQALMIAMVNQGNTEDTGRILDVQYLPFSLATSGIPDYIEFYKSGTLYPNAMFLSEDEYSYINNLPNLTNITNVDKECQTMKIVSPSRATQFLFRPYNNNGNMQFSTKINIQPFSSRIYVRPNTEGLLIYNWDDKDCFIMDEDCSLTKLDNNWQNYIYSNRTYNSQFEREIQGREFERGWERRVEQAQAKADEWTARNISAQKARTYTGNIPLISDIAGAIGTAWKDSAYMEMAQLDREYNEALYQQSVDLSRDLFTMQLENIQSQPTIPTKVTSLDNKLLDGIYLEEYNTNITERNTIEQFYYYNGSRIDDFGTFRDFWGHFVKGKIIISNAYTQPEITELNRRLETGLFTNYDEEDNT
ncbi:MAG: hypothetical protein RR839_00545 [Oscillospiraceae bacterium]